MSNVTELLKKNARKPRVSESFSGFGRDSTLGLQKLLHTLPHLGKVCEIGSCNGVSTETLALMCDHVIAVDAWQNYFESWTKFAELLKSHRNMSVLHMSSMDAACMFKDGVFDLVYIDADHSYESVYNDIMAWRPKVKSHGFIAGHDFTDPIADPLHEGVSRAVTELLGKPDAVFQDTSWLKELA